MLFMYVHTHTPERCIAGKQAELTKMATDMQAAAAKAGVKVLATYTAPHQHTIFSIMEASDLAGVESVLLPMTLWGDGELIPVLPMQLPPK